MLKYEFRQLSVQLKKKNMKKQECSNEILKDGCMNRNEDSLPVTRHPVDSPYSPRRNREKKTRRITHTSIIVLCHLRYEELKITIAVTIQKHCENMLHSFQYNDNNFERGRTE